MILLPACAQAPLHPPHSWKGGGILRTSPPEGPGVSSCLGEVPAPRGVGTETPLPALGRTLSSRGLGVRGGPQGWLHLQARGADQPGGQRPATPPALHPVAGVGRAPGWGLWPPSLSENRAGLLPRNFRDPEAGSAHTLPGLLTQQVPPSGDRGHSWACREERLQPNGPLKLGQHQVCAGEPRKMCQQQFLLSLWVPRGPDTGLRCGGAQ